MTDSPHSSEPVNFRTWTFKRLFDELPGHVQKIAHEKFRLFVDEPHSPVLRRKPLQGKEPYEEVRITISYRAIFRPGIVAGDKNMSVWVWVGSREATSAAIARLPKIDKARVDAETARRRRRRQRRRSGR